MGMLIPRNFVLALFVGTLTFSSAPFPAQADVTSKSAGFGFVELAIVGDITNDDYVLLSKQDWSPNNNADGAVLQRIGLNSAGGDVEAAMKIGRLFREHDIGVFLEDECSGPCVLILAGATSRQLFDNDKIALQRPHLGSTTGARSVQEMSAAVENLNRRVKAYLEEMGAHTGLYDDMMSAQLNKPSVISAEKVALYFPEKTPAKEAYERELKARKYNISPSELLARERDAGSQCSMRGNILLSAEFLACREAILLGVTRRVLDARLTRMNAECYKSKRVFAVDIQVALALRLEGGNACAREVVLGLR